MKVYLIYRVYEGLSPILYAFTNDKNLLKSFEVERNMNLFEVRTKEIDRDDYTMMKISHHDYALGRKRYITKPPSSYSLKTIVEITSTDKEEFSVFIQSDRLGQILAKHADPIIGEIVNDEIMEALNNLYYYNVLKYKDENSIIASGSIPMDQFLYFIDQFSMFLRLYGDTMSGEIYKYSE